MEKMSDFFTSRISTYDAHMINNVEGCKDAYKKMAVLIPESCKNLLDLGCGTGLELDEIFKLFPDIVVTGIDLTQAMLEKLKSKHPGKKMELICGDYFSTPFKNNYDCAVSFQTLHHFTHEEKTGLYTKIYNALKPNGEYIECDYMAETQEEEDFYFAENIRIRSELGIPEKEFYHYDTPCTVENQKKMLTERWHKKT